MSVTLYADDTSVLVTNYDRDEYKKTLNKIFSDINEWFNSNLLYLNSDKTCILEFRPRDNNFIPNNNRVKFLGLTLDTTLSWDDHINNIISKLNSACFLLRSVKPFISVETMRIIYFAYAHSIMTYGINFWGSSRFLCYRRG
jgi:hypothetical protein